MHIFKKKLANRLSLLFRVEEKTQYWLYSQIVTLSAISIYSLCPDVCVLRLKVLLKTFKPKDWQCLIINEIDLEQKLITLYRSLFTKFWLFMYRFYLFERFASLQLSHNVTQFQTVIITCCYFLFRNWLITSIVNLTCSLVSQNKEFYKTKQKLCYLIN